MAKIHEFREGPFLALGDDGKRYEVYHVRRISETLHTESETEGPSLTEPVGCFMTSAGKILTRVEKGVYRLDGYETVIIRSIDSNAP